MNTKNFRHGIGAVLTMVLVGCGGSDNDDNNESPPPVSNSAPEASDDTVTALNGETVTIDVLANDTDADGDALSISLVSDDAGFGTVVIENDVLLYTPQDNALGEDSFSYEVTDGQDTVTGNVTVINQQSLTLSGLVTDSPVVNAEVTITANGERFTAQADESGRYSLTMTLDNDTANLMITGNGAEEQQHISLVSSLGTFSDMLNSGLTHGERTISSDTDPSLIVSHVSTASVLLYADYLDGGGDDSFATFSAGLNSDQLMQLAGFIKLLSDNPAYTLAEGQSTYSLFNDAEGSVNDVITVYLNDNGFLNSDGSYTQAHQQALDTAIEETLNDENLSVAYVSEAVSGKTWAQYYSRGDLVYGGYVFTFNPDGTGFRTNVSQVTGDYYLSDFNWELVDGVVTVTYLNGHQSVGYPLCSQASSDDFIARWGKEASQVTQEMCANGEVPSNQVKVTTTEMSKRFLQRDGADGLFRSIMNGTVEHKMELNHDDPDSVTFTRTTSATSPFKYADMSSAIAVSDDLVRDTSWAAYLFSDMTYHMQGQTEPVATYEGLMWDIMGLTASNTISLALGSKTGTWTIENDVLQLTIGADSLTIQPFLRFNQRMLSLTTATHEGETFQFVSQLVPVESQQALEVSLPTQPSVIWTSYINAHINSVWNGDMLARDQLYGFRFTPEGSFKRCNSLASVVNCESDDFQWQWARDENRVTMTAADFYIRQREWQLVSVEADNMMYLIEWFSWIYPYDDFNIDPITLIPRLVPLKTLDWEALYQQSAGAGSDNAAGPEQAGIATVPGTRLAVLPVR